MKFDADRPFAEPEKAARKLIEIANAAEAVQDGRIHIELINMPFLRASGSADEYRAGIEHAIASGWIWRHAYATVGVAYHRAAGCTRQIERCRS